MARETFEGHVEFFTGAAVLFWGVYWESPLWLPLSQVTLFVDDLENDTWVLILNGWLADKNDLREFTHYTKEDIEERSQ